MFMPSNFELDSERNAERARVSVNGELDLATVPTLRQETHALLQQGASLIVLELSGLSFIDSSGLSLLIELHNRSTEEGWTLLLTRPSEKAFSVFRITGADTSLPFVDDEQAST
jgi:anti-sigma B factor antagonist